jgi:hypothetical protein
MATSLTSIQHPPRIRIVIDHLPDGDALGDTGGRGAR